MLKRVDGNDGNFKWSLWNDGIIKGYAGECSYNHGGHWVIKLFSRSSLGTEVIIKGVVGVRSYFQGFRRGMTL